MIFYPWSNEPLPDPSRTESGRVRCNEPLTDPGGRALTYCEVWVKSGRRKPHRGKHRVEWSS